MSISRTLSFAIALAVSFGLITCARSQSSPDRGVKVSPSELAAVDLTILPDGDNLPKGSGSVKRGAEVFAANCQACHGEAGRGGMAGVPALTGGVGSLRTDKPVKTVASYWPYATTFFDYTRRAMPPQAPQSLPANDLYAVTAYILSVDKIVPPNAVLDQKTLPSVRMPNRDGFVPFWKPKAKAGAKR